MRRFALVTAAALPLLLTGCAPAASPTTTPSATEDQLSGTVTVFAAASLTESFDEIADAFMVEHPGVTIVLNYGGSSGLAEQIVQGAPADVFAAASPSTMATVTDAGLAGAPQDFATNTLEIATPPGNPGGVAGLADFATPELALAVCAVEVPCGAATQKVFDAAGVVPSIDTYEQDVKAVLSRVELDEVDAGLVYRTDVIAAGDQVVGIEFPEASDAVNDYPIVALDASPNADAAAAFVAWVLSTSGQEILGAAGFGAP
jgi:molybdate transport system substrate-binding protein